MHKPHLFEPLTLRSVTFRNRIGVSPMCPYSCVELQDSIKLSAQLRDLGVDLVDCSSGGVSPAATIPVGPGYQTSFAAEIRREAGIPTAAVGMILSPHQAETILRTGQAGLVFLARERLRDPYWPRAAARALGADMKELVPAP